MPMETVRCSFIISDLVRCSQTIDELHPINSRSTGTLDYGEFCTAMGQPPTMATTITNTNITNTNITNVTHVHVHVAPTAPQHGVQPPSAAPVSKFVGGTVSVARCDDDKVLAHVDLQGAVSDYDYVALARADSTPDDYLTYEYNAEKLRRGVITLNHVDVSRADSSSKPFQLVLRYCEGTNWSVVAQSAPFDAPGLAPAAVSSSRVFVDFFEAGEPPRYFSAAIHVGFELLPADWSSSAGDWIALCAPGAPPEAYATYQNTSGDVAQGGASSMPAVRLECNWSGYFCLRYVREDGRVLAESEPFQYDPSGC